MKRSKQKYKPVRFLTKRTGYKRRPILRLLFVLGIIVAVSFPSFSSYRQFSHLKRVRKITELVFDAEIQYFNKRGRFSADLTKIDLPLPSVSKEIPIEYTPAHYEYDENQGYFYVAESLLYYTQTGDHYLITISQEQSMDRSDYPPVNQLTVIGFGKNLPVSFRKSYGYGEEYQRQFNRLESPEIATMCSAVYSSGSKQHPAQARRLCKQIGFFPEKFVFEYPSSDEF